MCLSQSSRCRSGYLDTLVAIVVAVAFETPARLQPYRAKHKSTLTTSAKTATTSRGRGSNSSRSPSGGVLVSTLTLTKQTTDDGGRRTLARVSQSQDVNKRHSIRVPDSAAPCVRVPKRASRMRTLKTVSVGAKQCTCMVVVCCQSLSLRRALCTRTVCV